MSETGRMRQAILQAAAARQARQKLGIGDGDRSGRRSGGMVERVARAIDPTSAWGDPDLAWADLQRQVSALDRARAAIEEMREPTEAMIDAYEATCLHPTEEARKEHREALREAWITMACEALK